ncbi:unnamed protein product [Pseudo-nitzschia multistriata]|uniref:Cytochrome P450 n=1 Tax=Pseudo-nitzschia multistriata TaxID=183589 RepID=A0A448Z9J9_9STRA|nr:unnamed protein product [Pseudo-nitzschia multistriata]
MTSENSIPLIQPIPILLGGLTALACVFVGTWWLYRKKTDRRTSTTRNDDDDDDDTCEYPPTPGDRHWLWGHALSLQPSLLGLPDNISHDVLFLAWMKKLKSKTVMFDLPIGRMIVVGDAAVAKHVLQSKTKSAFPKSPSYKSVHPVVGSTSIVVLEGKEWQTQRRLYNPGFSPDYLKSTVSIIAQKCDRFLTACDEEDIDKDLPTNLLDRSVDLTSDVIAQVAFGEDWGYFSGDEGTNEDKNTNIQMRKDGLETLINFRELTLYIGKNQKQFFQRMFNVLRMYRSWRLSVSIDRAFERLVRRRLDSVRRSGNIQPTNQKDILSLTLSSFLQESKNNSFSISSDHIKSMTHQLKTFYFAGHDTTATTISWAFWLLAQHPEKMEKARQEVRDIIGLEWTENVIKNGKNLEHNLTYEKLQQCQYLECIARESLRLYPPAATTRYAIDPDSRFGNLQLGASMIHLNVYAIQRDPDVWGPDANDFVPERFLGDEGRNLISSHSYLPFSKGSRDCIGKYFALLEAKIAIAALVTRYDGVPLDKENEVYMARITSLPENGCKMKLSRRVL